MIQQPDTQQLEIAVQQAGDIWQRIDALNILAWAVLPTDPQRACVLAEEARQLAVTGVLADSPYPKGLSESLVITGLLNLPESERDMHVRCLAQEDAARHQEAAELQERLHQLMTVLQVYDEVSSTLNIDSVQSIALDSSLRLSGARGGFIALMDDSGAVKVTQMIGSYPQDMQQIDLCDHELMREIAQMPGPTLLLSHSDFPVEAGFPTLPSTQARLIVPLISQEHFIGLVNLETDKPERFDKHVRHLLQILESYITVALENARLHQQVRLQLVELQRLYRQVSRLEQLKTDMIRVAAHDLRNPLSVILLNLQLLRIGTHQCTPEATEHMASIKNAAERMKKLLEDILSLERIEQMATHNNTAPVNLSAQVEKALAEYQAQAVQKSQEIRAHIAPEVILKGDESQLYEAITNLISNAVKYTPECGQIQIALKADTQQVTFKVNDTGYGIPESSQQHLFEPFYRVKTEETQKIEGTGLGLHLVKNIIERHNGAMIFHSVYGRGSTFGFILPRST